MNEQHIIHIIEFWGMLNALCTAAYVGVVGLALSRKLDRLEAKDAEEKEAQE